MSPAIEPVRAYFLGLQSRIVAALETVDGATGFAGQEVTMAGGGLSRPRVLQDGRHIEKAAVQFSHSIGAALPPAATARNPQLAGHGFQATAISLIVHPRNPYVPTTHMNLRYFTVDADDPVWYFGGGFDLTPYYPFDEDVIHWHSTARDACTPHRVGYRALKEACDDYFYLPHRQEPRGVGGLFFDDWTEGGFDASFDFVRSVGDHFLPAYQPIFEKRMATEWGDREEHFMLVRRGRYAEFNLAIDRGTKYGLQSGRRVESVLASLPPRVKWIYDYQPEAGSPEAALTERFLVKRDWIGAEGAVDNSVD